MVSKAELLRQRRTAQLRARTRGELLRRQQQEKRTAQQRQAYKEKVEGVISDIEKGGITSVEQIPSDVRSAIDIPKDYFSKVQAYEKWKKEVIKDKSQVAWSLYWSRKKPGRSVYAKDFPKEVQAQVRLVEKSMRHGLPISMIRAFEPKVPPGFTSPELLDLRESFAKSIRATDPRLTEYQIQGKLSESPAYNLAVKTLLSTPEQLAKQQTFAQIRGYETIGAEFGTIIPIRETKPDILYGEPVGGITFTIEEAKKRGITPTAEQIRKGAVFIPESQLKKEPWILPKFFEEPRWQREEREYDEQKSYEELLKEGNYPALIRKGYREGGRRGLQAVNLAIGKITGKDPPLTQEQMKRWGDFLGETGLFLFFSPLMTTGAYKKQTKTIQKQITKTRFDKLSRQFAELQRNVASKKTLNAQLKYLKGIKSQLKTEAQLKGFDKFLQHLIDNQILKISYAPLITKEPPIIFTPAPKIPTPVLISAEAVGKVSWFSTLGIKSETERKLEKEKERLTELEKHITEQKVNVKQATTLKKKQKEQQKLSELQKQLERQSQKYLVAQLNVQRQVSKQRTAQRQKELQRTKQVPKYLTMQTSVLKAKPKVKPKIPKPLFPIWFPKEKDLKKVVAKLPLEKKQQLYDVLIKRRKKFIKVFDDLPYNKAKQKGAIFTDSNLSATFKIVPDKMSKAPIKDIKTFTPDPKIFRNYKISKGKKTLLKNMWIEKRKARLNTASEIRQLLQAKRIAPKKTKKKSSKNNPIKSNRNVSGLGSEKKQLSNWLK